MHATTVRKDKMKITTRAIIHGSISKPTKEFFKLSLLFIFSHNHGPGLIQYMYVKEGEVLVGSPWLPRVF